MATMTSGQISIPKQIFDPWLGKVQGASTVAALSAGVPMLFGPGEVMTFDIGEAEYVGEGANKGGSTTTPTIKTVTPYKFHKTVRWTNEVMWADADHQLQVVQNVLDLIQPALSRALDYGVFHGINPTSGTAVPAMTESLSQTTRSVEIGTGKPFVYLDAADMLVTASSFVPKDVALDPSWASAFSTVRGSQTDARLYPNLMLDGSVSELEGHRAAVSRTVGAVGVAAVPTTVRGFVGDFSGIRWGIQRQINLELIEYGDPDGGGDLKRNNQVAFRSEIVYGWGIADLSAFAKIVDAA